MIGNIPGVLWDILNTFYERGASTDNSNNSIIIIINNINNNNNNRIFQNLVVTSKFYTPELWYEASPTLKAYKY